MTAEAQSLIADKTRDFVGREYVFSAIDDFVRSHPSGYFILEGDPGAGKSSILAELVRRTGWPAHFNIRAEGVSRWEQFIDNISDQVSARLQLPRPARRADEPAPANRLSRLLQEARKTLGTDERLVIAVDALDEVDLAGHLPGANILLLPQSLPDGIYFVLTKRRGDLPLSFTAPQQWCDLDQPEWQGDTDRDISTYIRRAAQGPKLRAWLDSQGLALDEFVQVVGDKSERNFMYLHYVLPEISAGVYGDWSVATLPRGLVGYYNDHWDRMGMRTSPLPRRKIRIIYVLTELQRAVSRSLIAQFSTEVGAEIDELAVQEVLDEWRQFLHEHATPIGAVYSIYHASFRDFLHQKEVVQAAGVSIVGINAKIADNLWQDLFGSTEA